jgi:hypothetical protein
MVCQDQETRDWLAGLLSTLAAWEGSRFKIVGLGVLPTFKRVAAWFPGPAEDTDTIFRVFMG